MASGSIPRIRQQLSMRLTLTSNTAWALPTALFRFTQWASSRRDQPDGRSMWSVPISHTPVRRYEGHPYRCIGRFDRNSPTEWLGEPRREGYPQRMAVGLGDRF